jgi:hypothetical protein
VDVNTASQNKAPHPHAFLVRRINPFSNNNVTTSRRHHRRQKKEAKRYQVCSLSSQVHPKKRIQHHPATSHPNSHNNIKVMKGQVVDKRLAGG